MENDTMLAQRRPAVQRAYRPEPVRFVGRVSYGLVAEIGTERYPVLADAVAKSRGRVLQWASDQIGLTDLAGASLSEPLDVPDMPGFKFGVAVSPDGATWVARMERPDRDVPQRAWTTEASVVTLEDSALFAVRNTCSAPSGPMAVPRSVPNFVKRVAKLVGLYDADEAITDVEWSIESEDDVADLLALVTSRDRFLPVVLVTQPYPLDVADLARKLSGVAHVVAMRDEFTRRWSDVIGKRFAAYFGAVRTYYPGVDVENSNPFEHPLVLRGRIPAFTFGEAAGPDAFRAVLSEYLYAANARRVAVDARFPRYAAVRAAALDAERASALDADDTAHAATLARAEIEQYKRAAKDAAELEAAALELNAGLDSENSRLNDNLYRMQIEVERLKQTLLAEGKPEDIPIPDSLADVAEWAEQYLAGRVVLLPRAVREAKKSIYKTPENVYRALLLLSDEYWRLKTGNGDQAALDARLDEMGMEFGISVGERGADDSYHVLYEGGRRFLDRAVKKGVVHNPRETMRIYLFWDNDHRFSVVGSMPEHLDNTRT